MIKRYLIVFSAVLASVILTNARVANAAAFTVQPPEVQLNGNFSRVQLVVTSADQSRDLTTAASFQSSDPAIVRLTKQGRLLAAADGTATVSVSVGDESIAVPVKVAGVAEQASPEFTTHVRPILNKLGCASAACHASQHGKGGFKLSVFGFDPAADHRILVRDSWQRRIDFVQPANSLFLQKPVLATPHGGGRRLELDSVEYHTLLAWITSGAPAPQKDAVTPQRLEVFPDRRLAGLDELQQLRVVAHYDDKSVRDVTALALFDTLDDGVVTVDENGRVRVVGTGQAPIMIRFEGQTAVSNFVVPYNGEAKLAGWKNNNFVDEIASRKFRELGLEPSPLCDDATFVRRAYLSAIGTLPTPDEAGEFLASDRSDKRDELIDRLLGLTGDPQRDTYNDQYAAFWTLKWSDLIRNSSNKLGEQGMWSLHNWIKESFRTNKTFDKFVGELVTGKGSIYMNGPANYFRVNANSSDLTEATAQLFLGIRLECAKCHHHPFEKYSQADYYGFSAFFSRVGTKTSQEFGLFGRETIVMVKTSGDVRHPKTGQLMKPTPPDGEPADHELDRRIPLAAWLTSADNEFFARSVANRYVGYLLGRGLVEPIDDMRSTNPPSNAELMDALAKHFVDSGFDLKQLVRAIMVSRLFQLDSQPTDENVSDHRFYSHYRARRLTAEPLLDAIDHVTGALTKFKSLPLGTRAIELPDAEYPNYFLTTFAKPRRASVCECERSPDENLAQALHTLNGDIVATKVADKDGRIARLLKSEAAHDEIVRDLYLAALSRLPTPAEVSVSLEFLDESPDAKTCYEDLLWALINSKQFLFIR